MAEHSRMRFSWRALLLAPLPIPFLYDLVLVIGGTRRGAPVSAYLFAFALFLIPGVAVSYGATVFGLLPALYLVSQKRPLSTPQVALIGAALGALSFLPVMWVLWKSSGPDSGPPVTSFLAELMAALREPLSWAFPVGGLVTASLYWRLARPEA